MTAGELLKQAQATFDERAATYGRSYHLFGSVMQALFPHGLVLGTTADWNRMGALVQIVNKLTRYSAHWDAPHKDSIHDIIVYAAILEELDDLIRH